jgi:hypothetical protein
MTIGPTISTVDEGNMRDLFVFAGGSGRNARGERNYRSFWLTTSEQGAIGQ